MRATDETGEFERGERRLCESISFAWFEALEIAVAGDAVVETCCSDVEDRNPIADKGEAAILEFATDPASAIGLATACFDETAGLGENG